MGGQTKLEFQMKLLIKKPIFSTKYGNFLVLLRNRSRVEKNGWKVVGSWEIYKYLPVSVFFLQVPVVFLKFSWFSLVFYLIFSQFSFFIIWILKTHFSEKINFHFDGRFSPKTPTSSLQTHFLSFYKHFPLFWNILFTIFQHKSWRTFFLFSFFFL